MGAGRGRTKDRTKDAAVLDATVRLLAAEGYARTSMERVAATAGVSKVTVYARWSTKAELVGAALAHLRVGDVPDPVGRVRDDLVALLEAMRAQYAAVGGLSILGTCLAGEAELLDVVRRSTLLPRRELFARVVADAVTRGELRADVDVERAVSLVVGSFYADRLAGRDVDADSWAADVVDAVLAGLVAR